MFIRLIKVYRYSVNKVYSVDKVDGVISTLQRPSPHTATARTGWPSDRSRRRSAPLAASAACSLQDYSFGNTNVSNNLSTLTSASIAALASFTD